MPQNITSVNPSTKIKANDFNSIESVVANVIRDYYGFQGANSLPVSTGTNTITMNQINGVISDLDRCNIHQSNTSSGLSYVTSSTEITAAFFNNLGQAASQIVNNQNYTEPNQLLPDTTNATSARTTVWGSAINHTVVYSWNDSTQAQYFFNLGGYIRPSIRVTSSGSNSAIDQTWITLINQASTLMNTISYTRTDFVSTSTGIKSVVLLLNGANIIQAQFTKPTPSSIQYELTLQPQQFSSIDVQMVSTVTNYYSRGDLGGVPAPRPGVASVDFFGTAGSVIQHTKTLVVTLSTNTFTTTANGNPTNVATMTLSNVGNTTLTVNSITFNNGDASLTPQFTGTQAPFSLTPNSSQVFSLSYLATTQGNYNSAITIISDNDQGSVILKTIQNILPSVFVATLLPTNVNKTVNQLCQLPQKFTIFTQGGVLQSYTASFQTSSSSGFHFNPLTVDGPIVIFDPISANLSAGTYSATVSVTVVSSKNDTVTTSSTITYQYIPVSTQNLGSWLSPFDANNAIAGFSYDVINGKRYLTIGFGMGADGSSSSVTNYTIPGTYQYTIPNGVTQLMASVKGGAGGGGGADSNAGASGYDSAGVSGYVNVIAGQTYTILVGGGGGKGINNQSNIQGGGGGISTGGYSGGTGGASGSSGTSGSGGGGGAASAILINGTPIVVAGGGGGGGGGGNHSPGLPQQGNYNSTSTGTNGTSRGGDDGAGAGGGGGGYPFGGLGGDIQGGDNGGYSGTTGQSLIPSGMLANNGVKGGNFGITGVQDPTMGQNGSVSIAIPYASTSNLGVLADLGFDQQSILYNCSQQPNYCPLLQSYGAWVNTTGIPQNIDITRSYTITAPDTGVYDWSFAVNSSGYFNIDGVRIGDLSNLASSNYTTGISGSVTLTAGTHTLSFGVNNSSSMGSSNQGAIALTLIDRSSKQMVWCTLYPIRLNSSYNYWQEVVRIPVDMDGTQHTYNSQNYLIKDTLPVSSGQNKPRWGDYFGSGTATGSMFTVNNDGYGNLSIMFNPKSSNTGVVDTQQTVDNVQYLPYYYSTAENRFTNIQGLINGNKTQYFLGFNQSGSTVTSIVMAPS
jgi:hypothetical protein